MITSENDVRSEIMEPYIHIMELFACELKAHSKGDRNKSHQNWSHKTKVSNKITQQQATYPQALSNPEMLFKDNRIEAR